MCHYVGGAAVRVVSFKTSVGSTKASAPFRDAGGNAQSHARTCGTLITRLPG